MARLKYSHGNVAGPETEYDQSAIQASDEVAHHEDPAPNSDGELDDTESTAYSGGVKSKDDTSPVQHDAGDSVSASAVHPPTTDVHFSSELELP